VLPLKGGLTFFEKKYKGRRAPKNKTFTKRETKSGFPFDIA